jgi:hypothetical protein
VLSIGLMAWNEEEATQRTLEALFRQSVFERLCIRHEQCEVLVIAHACIDHTAAVARRICERMTREHPWADGFTARVIDIPDPGRASAWNRFVHEFSAVEARFLCSMHVDILFHHRDTIYNLLAVLERRPHVSASADRPCKDIIFKERKTLWERLSLATSLFTGAEGRLCSQLYCLRASVARNIFIPRDLEPTADGFIKEMVCTQFLTRDARPGLIALAPEAAHLFEATLDPREILDHHKRQMMGQAAVQVLVGYLRRLPAEDRIILAETLRRQEARDPDWLKRLVAAHVHSRRHFWQLFPGILSFRWRRLWRLPGFQKLTFLPAAFARYVLTIVAGARAHATLRRNLAPCLPAAGPRPAVDVPQVGAK